MTTRARKNSILIALNTVGGKVVDMTTLADGSALVYDEETDRYTHASVDLASHDHEIGDMTLIFENALI